MLTEAEKKWLEERETLITENEAWYTCAYCEKFRPNYLCRSALCPVDVGHVHNRNVAEFEARVAAKLAMRVVCHHCPVFRPCTKRCDWERLKYARLAVEKEMECTK